MGLLFVLKEETPDGLILNQQRVDPAAELPRAILEGGREGLAPLGHFGQLQFGEVLNMKRLLQLCGQGVDLALHLLLFALDE